MSLSDLRRYSAYFLGSSKELIDFKGVLEHRDFFKELIAIEALKDIPKSKKIALLFFDESYIEEIAQYRSEGDLVKQFLVTSNIDNSLYKCLPHGFILHPFNEKMIYEYLVLKIKNYEQYNKDVSKKLSLIQKEKEKIEGEAKSQGNFLATMSHEIRTPLNGMIPYIDLLLEERSLNEKQLEYLTIIQNSSGSLLRLINDILDFSKLESKKLEIEQIRLNLVVELEGVVELYSPKANEKEIILYSYIDPTLPTVVGDPLRLKQVVNNLFSNAIKFTPEKGEICFQVTKTKESKSEIGVEITIKDSGEGIEPSMQKIIFSPFTQSDNTVSRKHGGTGLGLSISKTLVELMGGELKLFSKPMRGAEFKISLTLPKPESKIECKYTDIIEERSIAIYLTSTNYIKERRLLSRYLTAMGYSFTYLEDLTDDNLDEIGVLFILSSGKDELRIDPYHNTRIISIMPSAVEDSNRYRSDVVIKMPLNGSKIYDAINDISKLTVRKKESKSSSVVYKYNARVLAVEDNTTNQKLIDILLHKHGIKADIASNGVEALERYESNKYDLILMDIHMPVMNGLEALVEIRRREEANVSKSRSSVIALTADAIKEHQLAYLEAGFNAVFPKPIDKDAFAELLEEHLSFTRVQESVAVDNIATNDTNIINNAIKTIEKTVGVDQGVAQMLFDDFWNNWTKTFPELEEAVEKLEHEKIRSLAHFTKGASGSLGFDKFYKNTLAMEKLAVEQSNNIEQYQALLSDMSF